MAGYAGAFRIYLSFSKKVKEKMKKRAFCLLFISVWVVSLSSLWGQTHYSCDFENESECSQWSLNPICNPAWGLKDLGAPWYIGSAINNGGTKSLYVSKDAGLTASSGNGCTVYAYRDVALDAGHYELSFDWLTGAAGNRDVLFVAWIPAENIPETRLCCLQGALARPAFLDQYGLRAIGSKTDSLSSTSWKTSVFSFESDGQPGRLVFTWLSKGTNVSIKGACVDNIYIKPEGGCPMPTGLTTTIIDNTIVFDWQGDSDALYDVKCYSYATDTWQQAQGVKGLTYTFYGLQPGQTDFYVRTTCGDEDSHWVQISDLLYFAEEGCVNYLHLADENCYTGEHGGNRTFVNRARGKVDFGPGDMENSRHTVHMTQGEYDANTNYLLPTIPPGELAAVRLGNWDVGAEAEMIEYEFVVDAEYASVLLMKYAVVMDEPTTPHDEETQSAFTLQILHRGVPIDCASASFSANYGTQDNTWHQNSASRGTIWWKEWTTIGVNLEDYDGETLTVRVCTFDCTASGHACYAYFTLECTSGEMDGITCGENLTNEFIAPEGFNYRWYLPDEPDRILGTERTFEVDGTKDTLTYYCDVIFPSNKNCYFTLTASAIPRFPVAEATYKVDIADCRNLVSFTNLSHILTRNQITTDSTHTPLPCETIYWDFGDGTSSYETNPTHEFPQEGGTFDVTLRAGISDDLCTDEVTYTITLPRLGTMYDTIPMYGCTGTPLQLPDGRFVYSDGIYQADGSNLSQYGCDSIVVYDVKFNDQVTVELFDTICSNESYYFDGEARTESGVYTAKDVSVGGCDSTTVLNLTVFDDLQVEIVAQPYACADERVLSVDYSVVSGAVDEFIFDFDALAEAVHFTDTVGHTGASPLSIALPDNVRPGLYTSDVIFVNTDCGNDTLELAFTIYYPSSIVTQRWNDVLFLQNAEYNGGYSFSAYQWYKNDEAIAGETGSYLYVPEGLDRTAEYRVEVTRSDDGVTTFTCPVVPYDAGGASLTLSPNVLAKGAVMKLGSPEKGRVSVYGVSGVLVEQHELSEGTNLLQAPAQTGYYLLKVNLDNGMVRTFHLQVVE